RRRPGFAAGDDDLAAGGFDRGDRRLRGAGDLDRQRRLQLALGEQADAGAELAGVDRLLQPAEIDDLVVLAEDLVVEAALRQPPVQRGLAALEAVERDAGARGLALAAAARGLALARADAAADALGAVMRALVVPDLVELHRLSPERGRPARMRPRRPRSYSSTTRTRCCTLRIMPRTAGVSSRVRRR